MTQRYLPHRGCPLLDRDRRACFVSTDDRRRGPACLFTLGREGTSYQRLIKSLHLSRPEHYLSIYQSGCNMDCAKCHSAEFSQHVTGTWLSAGEIARIAAEYAKEVTVTEPRHRATMFHAEDLCWGCGGCLIRESGRERPEQCPGVLEPDQIVLSPQGLGPARNIVGFTGGDVACAPEFYEQAAHLIKEQTNSQVWVLLETNGLGLDRPTLERLATAGVDALWLDIKAFDDRTHRELTGVSNERVLSVPQLATDLGLVVEVLTLFIPGQVEADQIEQIARLCASVDPEIPLTVLAFFPAHRMQDVGKPTLEQMLETGRRVRDAGVRHLRLGNRGVFCRTADDLRRLEEFEA